MREGVRRCAIVVWWLSALWLGGSILYLTFSNEPMGDDLGRSVLAKGLIFAPGFVGVIVAWVLEEFVEKP